MGRARARPYERLKPEPKASGLKGLSYSSDSSLHAIG
jgi:hypothetical protein